MKDEASGIDIIEIFTCSSIYGLTEKEMLVGKFIVAVIVLYTFCSSEASSNSRGPKNWLRSISGISGGSV